MKSIKYLTLLDAGEAECEIERSHFIGYARPATSAAAARSFFDEIRKLHRQATHNVPAYVIGADSGNVWCSDDGEPAGTSGAPILHLLTAKGITDAAVIVTRYFGGTKLGTGGLVRAYSRAAELALAAAVVCEVIEKTVITWTMDYSSYNKIEILAKTHAELFEAANPEFTANVRFDTVFDKSLRERLLALVSANCPTAEIISEEAKFLKVPIVAEEVFS